MAAELADEIQRCKRAEADTREAQAALEVKVHTHHKKEVCDICHPSLQLLLLLLISGSFVVPCSSINKKIYSLSAFAPHQ